MPEKWKESSRIVAQNKIGHGIYSMWLQTGQIARHARPGQFISVYSTEGSRLLPRPISICEIDKEMDQIRIVYRIAGKGTEEFSKKKVSDVLEIMGPLGNGFPLERMTEGKTAMLIGGGIGIPPMLELSKQLSGAKNLVMGYRDELFLHQELEKNGTLYIATEDGSCGTKGNVLQAISSRQIQGDLIYACGPTPMLRAVKEYAQERGMECWISVEERMACGIGACLACVCQSKEVDAHSQVKNKRVCKEGPVFLATEVEL